MLCHAPYFLKMPDNCDAVVLLIFAVLTFVVILGYITWSVYRGGVFNIGDIVAIVIICVAAIAIFIRIMYKREVNRTDNNVLPVFSACHCTCTNNKISHKMKRVDRDCSDCAICLEKKDPRVKTVVAISCNHTYHKMCIKEYLIMDKNVTCPKCRQPPISYSSLERLKEGLKSLFRNTQYREYQETMAMGDYFENQNSDETIQSTSRA